MTFISFDCMLGKLWGASNFYNHDELILLADEETRQNS